MRFSAPIALSIASLALGATAQYNSYSDGYDLYARDAEASYGYDDDLDLYARDAEAEAEADFDDEFDFDLYTRDAEAEAEAEADYDSYLPHELYARDGGYLDEEALSSLVARSLSDDDFDINELAKREPFFGAIIKGISKGAKAIANKVKGKKHKAAKEGADMGSQAAQYQQG